MGLRVLVHHIVFLSFSRRATATNEGARIRHSEPSLRPARPTGQSPDAPGTVQENRDDGDVCAMQMTLAWRSARGKSKSERT
ncbi:unnamed protein product [Mycena citricolor]|uniref:Secreted protein n=1 Tax=Mycena citricolor TaxID=2018698 RepID=A0AAD2K0F4_9AGAR|nr:unnamed protein product [Mycena citricolor]